MKKAKEILNSKNNEEIPDIDLGENKEKLDQ